MSTWNWSAPTNNSVGGDPRTFANELHPLIQQGLHAMEQAYPGYIAGIQNGIHQYGTSNGQWGLVGDQRNAYNAAATDAGRAQANQVGFQGGGETAQNAARMQAQQQGFRAGNSAQAQMGSPQGQMQNQAYVQSLMGQLSGGPAMQAWQQQFQNEMQRRQINNMAPQSPGLIGSILGAAAPFAGMIPGMGGHAAAAIGGMAGGGAGGSLQGAITASQLSPEDWYRLMGGS